MAIYPGSALGGRTDLGDADIAAIREGTEKAHAIIALIDGQKVLQSIEGRDVRDTLMSDLNILVSRLMHGAEKPVTFLLTKYDILDGVHSLLRIRQELFKSDDFRAIVKLRRAHGLPLHLIPISAVGSSFARFDPADGRMKKMVGGAPDPLNTEFALGCTVINQFKLFEEQRLERSFRTMIWRRLPPILKSSPMRFGGRYPVCLSGSRPGEFWGYWEASEFPACLGHLSGRSARARRDRREERHRTRI